MNCVIGIDPGMSGAMSTIWNRSDESFYHVEDLPVMTDMSLAWIDGGLLQSELMKWAPQRPTVVIERVSAMPGQGVSSCFKFGAVFGSILSVVQAIGFPIEFVSPAVWKRDLGLIKDKKAALHKARLLFPHAELHLAKHDGRAEALLIAHWYLRHGRTPFEAKLATGEMVDL